MNEFYLITGVSLAADIICAVCSYVAYYKTKKLFDTFMTSLNRGINKVTINEVKNSTGPHYSIVRGSVKPLGPPIKSLNRPFSGVIQILTIKEHSVLRKTAGFWSDIERILDKKVFVVPFEVRSENYKVAITSPLEASYLNLEVIDDRFERFEPSFSTIVNLLFGIHRKGYQFTEFLLKEDAIITAFGELAKNEKDELQLMPPKSGLYYVLTTMDPETLLRTIRKEKKYLGVCCLLFTSIGVAIFAVIIYKLWKERQARLQREKMKFELMRQRSNRNTISIRNDEEFSCIVCVSKPREVVMIPCGHICICFDCSVQLHGRPCPVCQQRVSDVHLIYIS